MQISNWGNYPVIEADVEQMSPGGGSELRGIPRGLGRCYGDAALAERIVSTPRCHRLLDFDAQSGLLTAESGLSIADLLRIFIPRGWFMPVTPGTKYVTLGGALASDVHGKNHHKEGSIGQYVKEISLQLPSGELLSCSPKHNTELFWATIGGMGLTGLILNVSLQLRPIQSSALVQDSYKASNLQEMLALFDMHEEATYSVGWIDCLAKGKREGRSLLMIGEHAEKEAIKQSRWDEAPLRLSNKAKITVPFALPGFTLNRFTIGAFNTLFYHKQRKNHLRSLTDYDSFFYPLDVIHRWNMIYGKRGFTQYQLVIPREAGETGLFQILRKVREAGFGSFLAVLKVLGPSSEGMISFPMEGYTLTLDFPITKRLFTLLDELDHIVLDHGGRVYLAKDARLSGETFRKMYPRWEEFVSLRRKIDPEGRMQSLQSQRLGI